MVGIASTLVTGFQNKNKNLFNVIIDKCFVLVP